MHHSLSPEISESYEPKAHNGTTLRYWLESNIIHTATFIMAHQVVFPIVAAVLIILGAIMLIHTNQFNYGEKVGKTLNDVFNNNGEEKKLEVITNICVISALSFWITLYIFIMDAIGLGIAKNNGGELRNYSLDNNTYGFEIRSNPLRTLYSLSAFMLAQSGLITLLMIIYFTIFMIFLFVPQCDCQCASKCGECQRCQCASKCDEVKKYMRKALPFTYLYFPIFPLMNISFHFTHILIGFIHNPFHATSVAIFYGGVVIIIFLTSMITSYLYKLYFWKQVKQRYSVIILTIIHFILVFFCMGFAAFMATLYFLIPINHAFDEAPDRLRTIFDTLIVAFTGAIAYFLFQEKRKEKEKREAEEQRGERQLQTLKDILGQVQQQQQGNEGNGQQQQEDQQDQQQQEDQQDQQQQGNEQPQTLREILGQVQQQGDQQLQTLTDILGQVQQQGDQQLQTLTDILGQVQQQGNQTTLREILGQIKEAEEQRGEKQLKILRETQELQQLKILKEMLTGIQSQEEKQILRQVFENIPAPLTVPTEDNEDGTDHIIRILQLHSHENPDQNAKASRLQLLLMMNKLKQQRETT